MSWRRRVLLSAVPFAIMASVAGAAWLALPRGELLSFLGITLLSFPGGRFVTLLPVAEGGLAFSPLFIAGLVSLVEACIALFVTVNLDILYRAPWVGQGLRTMERNQEATLAGQPWVRRMTELGLVLFLSLPLPATGAVSGTIIARLVGLGVMRSLFAVVAGNALGAYALALTAETAIAWIPAQDSGLVGALRFGAVVAIIVLLSWIGHRRVRGRER